MCSVEMLDEQQEGGGEVNKDNEHLPNQTTPEGQVIETEVDPFAVTYEKSIINKGCGCQLM